MRYSLASGAPAAADGSSTAEGFLAFFGAAGASFSFLALPFEGVPVEGVPVEGVPVEGVAKMGVRSEEPAQAASLRSAQSAMPRSRKLRISAAWLSVAEESTSIKCEIAFSALASSPTMRVEAAGAVIAVESDICLSFSRWALGIIQYVFVLNCLCLVVWWRPGSSTFSSVGSPWTVHGETSLFPGFPRHPTAKNQNLASPSVRHEDGTDNGYRPSAR